MWCQRSPCKLQQGDQKVVISAIALWAWIWKSTILGSIEIRIGLKKLN